MTGKKKIIVNIFSNWTNLIILVGIAFIVSPIMVHRLGNEFYGIWTLIVSVTGYFSVLDFGVNTAIVRFISMYVAQKKIERANEVFNTSFIFFFGIPFEPPRAGIIPNTLTFINYSSQLYLIFPEGSFCANLPL